MNFRVAQVAIKQVPGVDRHADLIAAESAFIILLFLPHVMLKVVRYALSAGSHLMPELPQQANVVVVRDRWAVVIPRQDGAPGICLNIVVNDVCGVHLIARTLLRKRSRPRAEYKQ